MKKLRKLAIGKSCLIFMKEKHNLIENLRPLKNSWQIYII